MSCRRRRSSTSGHTSPPTHRFLSMQFGFSSMNTPADLAPDVLARELEARAYESLWVGEHSHIPVSRKTPYPTGGEMPDQYRWMMDPFLSLLAAALATDKLLIGT